MRFAFTYSVSPPLATLLQAWLREGMACFLGNGSAKAYAMAVILAMNSHTIILPSIIVGQSPVLVGLKMQNVDNNSSDLENI
jgi:hypothetical protein